MLYKASEPPRQVQLNQVVVVDGIEDRQVIIVAAGAETLIDLLGVAVAHSADNRVRDAVGQSGIDSFEIGAALKEVRVQQVHINGILLNVLPIDPCLPGVPLNCAYIAK